MKLEYSDSIGSSRWWILGRLLHRWRGSVHKVVWGDLLVYALLYAAISCLYRFYLDDPGKRIFEEIVMQSGRYRDQIPVSLLLGFYVWLVVSRWWAVCLAFPDNTNTAILLATHIPGNDNRTFEVRTRIVRYINLMYCMVFTHVSPVVRKKFPDTQTLVHEHFATTEECEVLVEVSRYGSHVAKWVPVTWCCQLVQNARDEGFLQTEDGKEDLVKEILDLRRQCGVLLDWHQHNIPLLYTQVVTMAVYTYFLVSLVSEQFLDERLHYHNYEVDMVVPILAILQLIFYLGWLKVAAALLNPFGIHDQDFDMLKILDTSRTSAFVVSHTRYGHYTAEAQWAPGNQKPGRFIDLDSSSGEAESEEHSMKEPLVGASGVDQ